MRCPKPFIVVSLICLLVAACNTPPDVEPSEDVVAFVNVTVIPMDRERVVKDQTVIVRSGRIQEIGPTLQIEVPDRAVVIEGRGKYLMPGLADMHVHIYFFSEDALDLFIANGVTTIRNMWGRPDHLEWRARIEDGDLLGPTIYSTGPITDGNPVFWEGSTVVETPEEAEQEVIAQKQAGYDGMKVFTNLSPEVYEALLDAAREHDFPVYGHVPTRVGLEKALNGGQKSFEHMMDFMYALVPDDSPARAALVEVWADRSKRSLQGMFFLPYSEADPGRIPALVAKVTAAGVWICPALVQQRKLASNSEEFTALGSGSSMQYVAPDDLDYWNAAGSRFSSDQGNPAAMKRGVDTMLRIVKALHDSGAHLLIGTDTPNPFVVPGFSVHEELQNFVDAGLTPYEALRAATRDPAEFLDAADEFGTVAVGRRADLILVDANPLENVENAAKRVGVMVRGRWFAESDLRSRLEALAQSYRR